MNTGQGRVRKPPVEFIVGSLDDFPPDTHRVVRAGGREIGVFNIGGNLYGLPNLCPHQQGPLCESARCLGTTVASAETGWRTEWGLDREVVSCPWHGLEYHVPTGRCLAFGEIHLRTYRVEARDGAVVLSI